MPIDSTFLQARIDATKLQIEAYEAASLALGTDAIQSYSLDTGQSIIKVTKLDLEHIDSRINSLYNRLATLCARKDGSGTYIRQSP